MNSSPSWSLSVKQAISVFVLSLDLVATRFLLSRKPEQVQTARQAFRIDCQFHSCFL